MLTQKALLKILTQKALLRLPTATICTRVSPLCFRERTRTSSVYLLYWYISTNTDAAHPQRIPIATICIRASALCFRERRTRQSLRTPTSSPCTSRSLSPSLRPLVLSLSLSLSLPSVSVSVSLSFSLSRSVKLAHAIKLTMHKQVVTRTPLSNNEILCFYRSFLFTCARSLLRLW
jgi:hypothetical protein